MKLSKEQVDVLRRCALYASKYVPVISFKGEKYIVFKDLKDDVDLNIHGDVIAPLFENRYLEMIGKDTCKLSDVGQIIFERMQNSI